MIVGISMAEGASPPAYATLGAAGADLRAYLPDGGLAFAPGERRTISTGVTLEIPEGYEGQVRPRSGLAHNKGITVLNTPGTIDSDYRGVVGVILYNAGHNQFMVNHGDRIAQIVFCPVQQVVFSFGMKTATERGVGGFGSTGVG